MKPNQWNHVKVQAPCRALLVDLAPASQQNLGQAMFSAWMALGNICGYGTSSEFNCLILGINIRSQIITDGHLDEKQEKKD